MKAILFIFFFICMPMLIYADDIIGFNFGGKFENYDNYSEISGDKLFPHEYMVQNVKFFDFANIGTSEEKTIKSIVFVKSYKISYFNIINVKRTILEDFKSILSSIEKRYGEFDKSKANNILGIYGKTNAYYLGKVSEVAMNRSPDSEKIGLIILVLKGEENLEILSGEEKTIDLNLLYFDTEYAQLFENNREDRTRGF